MKFASLTQPYEVSYFQRDVMFYYRINRIKSSAISSLIHLNGRRDDNSKGSKKDFYWTETTSIRNMENYSWAPFEPNNAGGNEKCLSTMRYEKTERGDQLMYYGEFGLNDVSCQGNRAQVLCEMTF